MMNKISIPNYPMVNPTPIVLIGADVDGKPNHKVLPESMEKYGRLDIGLTHEEITKRII